MIYRTDYDKDDSTFGFSLFKLWSNEANFPPEGYTKYCV